MLLAIADTLDFEIPSIPSVYTCPSTRLVDALAT